MTPPEKNGDAPGSLENRVWRIEQRQLDVIKRVEHLENNLELVRRSQDGRTWKIEAIENKTKIMDTIDSRIDTLRSRIEDLERKPSTSVFGDSKTIQVLVYGFVALVSALLLGKVFVFPGG